MSNNKRKHTRKQKKKQRDNATENKQSEVSENLDHLIEVVQSRLRNNTTEMELERMATTILECTIDILKITCGDDLDVSYIESYTNRGSVQ